MEKEKTIVEEHKNQQAQSETSAKGYMTTNTGCRINDTDNSATIGARGPIIMEDFHFREKITHFDHERIPERVVHARGSGAHGYFQVYESFAKYSKAKFLCDPTIKTPTFVRFSTVAGNRGSPDTPRDVRGFATRFYTPEGNFDLVGNNIPVFFIQDAIKFPDVIHAVKPEPDNEIPQASSAHDSFWDFISLMPESAHMIMWVFSERGIPKSYATMEGFGVHTFRLVNEQGKATFCKFHWKPVMGFESLVWDEAMMLKGIDPDFNRRDLWERIEKGDYPEYELGVQLVEEDQFDSFAFDLLDSTKIIPEELVPVTIIGKMTLNKNPDNFFAETEQVAFHLGHLVPGIDVTNDPLFQGRLFSYLDTQLNRFNSVNFQQLPINRPICEVYNNQQEGFMRMRVDKNKANYFPNSLSGGCPFMASFKEGGYVHHPERVEGVKVRERSRSFKDFFSQATLFWNSMSDVEKQHLIWTFRFEIGRVQRTEIRKRMVALLSNIDLTLAQEVAKFIGVDPPQGVQEAFGVDYKLLKELAEENKKKKHVNISPALSMFSLKKDSIKTKRVAILIEDGYDSKEFAEMMAYLMKEGAWPEIISMFFGPIKGSAGEQTKVDKTHHVSHPVLYDAVFIPGGKHVETMKQVESMGSVISFINTQFKHCKPVAASGEAVALLSELVRNGVKVAGPEDGVVEFAGVVTKGGKGDLGEFKTTFRNAIAVDRHYVREQKKLILNIY